MMPPIANAIAKPRWVCAPPGVSVVASPEAATCVPIAPPSVRMRMLTPVATPVWPEPTFSITRLTIEANAKPVPAPSAVDATMICHGWSCWSSSQTKPAVLIAQPITSGRRDTKSADSRSLIELATATANVHGTKAPRDVGRPDQIHAQQLVEVFDCRVPGRGGDRRRELGVERVAGDGRGLEQAPRTRRQQTKFLGERGGDRARHLEAVAARER
jgi:hypothetical protein